MISFRIETDETLRQALGTDGAEWASAYINGQRYREGDLRHIELTAWFNAAVTAGRTAEHTSAISSGMTPPIRRTIDG